MTVQNSTAVRNAQGDAWETAIGTSAKLQIWSGSPPSNCAAASTGTKLAEYSLASDWTAAASSGAKTLISMRSICTHSSLARSTRSWARTAESTRPAATRRPLPAR